MMIFENMFQVCEDLLERFKEQPISLHIAVVFFFLHITIANTYTWQQSLPVIITNYRY